MARKECQVSCADRTCKVQTFMFATNRDGSDSGGHVPVKRGAVAL